MSFFYLNNLKETKTSIFNRVYISHLACPYFSFFFTAHVFGGCGAFGSAAL